MGLGKASSRDFSWCWISDSAFSPAGAGVTASDFEISMADNSSRKIGGGKRSREQSQRGRSRGIIMILEGQLRQTRPTAVAIMMTRQPKGSVNRPSFGRYYA